MNLIKLLSFSFLIAMASCSSLKYEDDVGFLVSAQADSPEYPVYINSHLCTDMEGFPGLCSKRVSSTEDIIFKFDSQTYAYLLTMSCTQGVNVVQSATVPAGQGYSLTIKSADFSQFISFTCIGEVSPQDRTPPISAKFKVSFTVNDAKYVKREAIFVQKTGNKTLLVLGQFARTAWVYDEGKWSQHQEETTVEIKDSLTAKAYSESYAMRFNYFNMGDSDGGPVSTTVTE